MKAKPYFGPNEEQAVKTYLYLFQQNPYDLSVVDLMYKNSIHPLLEKIARGVAAKLSFKPVSYYRSDAVINACISHLWEVLILKYEVNKGTKAYSYLTKCADSFYKGVARKYSKSNNTIRRKVSAIASIYTQANTVAWSTEDIYIMLYDNEESRERLKKICDHFEHMRVKVRRKSSLSGVEEKVLEAIRILLYSCDDIEIFNKKAVYLYLREITGLKTKQIVNVLNKMKNISTYI